MRRARVAIVAAMREEVGPLRGRLRGVGRLPIQAALAVTGSLAGCPVALVVTGDGERNARAGIAALFDYLVVERLLIVGVAGALTHDLRPAALVAAKQVHAGGTAIAADGAWLLAAIEGGARPVALISAARLADTPAERARLLAAHGDPISAAVDLESAVLAQAALERGIPWLALRSISDTADEHLPPLLERSRDEGGATRRGRVVAGLLREPAAMPALLSLRWRVARCAQVLAVATERLLGLEAQGGAA
jgi:adenosylhomocysteine nucleosidase